MSEHGDEQGQVAHLWPLDALPTHIMLTWKASWQMGPIHSWRCCAASRWLRSVVVSRKALVSLGQLSPSAGSTDTQSARRMTRRSPRRLGPVGLSPAGPRPPSRTSQLSSRATPDGLPAYSRPHTFRQDFCGMGERHLGGGSPCSSAQHQQGLLVTCLASASPRSSGP